MPRAARKISQSGVYHIVLRGINKQTVFYDDEDKKVFLNRLKLIKEQNPYELYAYCLMSNHIHLLIKGIQPMGKIMQKVLCSYVHWYNRKYERIGNLFQDRYKSEPIEKDSHLLCCVRYIHQNPVKAGITNSVDAYEWSSHDRYIKEKESLVNTRKILDIVGGKAKYKTFIAGVESQSFLEYENNPPLSDEKLLTQVQDLCIKYKVNNIVGLEKGARDELLSKIRQIPGTSIRQISRVTGVPASIVRYAE